MFSRLFVRSVGGSVFGQAPKRLFCNPSDPPPFKEDSGFDQFDLERKRAAELETVEITDDNYFDVLHEDEKRPILVHCIDPSHPVPYEEWIKNVIHTTHGKIKYAYFDPRNNPETVHRLRVPLNAMAVVQRGSCTARSDVLNERRQIHDFIRKFSWLLNV